MVEKTKQSAVLLQFPKKFTPPPEKAGLPTRSQTANEAKNPRGYHDEIFEYNDGSYVILVQPKKQKFTVERMVFMAERLKMTLFDALPCYEDDEDFYLELEPDPKTPA